MSEHLPRQQVESPRHGAGRAGVGRARPHTIGPCRLDKGGAVRSALGSFLPLAVDEERLGVAERASRAKCCPSPPWLQGGAMTLREVFEDCSSLQTESNYSDLRKALCL